MSPVVTDDSRCIVAAQSSAAAWRPRARAMAFRAGWTAAGEGSSGALDTGGGLWSRLVIGWDVRGDKAALG